MNQMESGIAFTAAAELFGLCMSGGGKKDATGR